MNKFIANAYADDIARRAEERAARDALLEKRMFDALFDRGDVADDREPTWA